MRTAAEEREWDHRYDRETSYPIPPAEENIDNGWRLIKSITDVDGAFNGGIDLVESKGNHKLAVRKRLRAHRDCGQYEWKRWRREMLILRKLSHPNIPAYIDGFYMHEKGSIYMQPCRLGSVSSFVERRMNVLPFKVQEFFLWYILHEVAEAVLYMQTGFQTLADANRSKRDKVKGWVSLVHGDIRPDQIFLNDTRDDPTPRVLLGDFGLAQFIKPWHRTEIHDGPGARCGSRAPEFPNEISDATDIFGLGATAQLYLFPDQRPTSGLREASLTRYGVGHELAALVCDCVAVRVSIRPTIWELLERLKLGLAARLNDGFDVSMLRGPLFKCLYAFPILHRLPTRGGTSSSPGLRKKAAWTL